MRLVYKKEAGGKGSQPQVVSDIRNEARGRLTVNSLVNSSDLCNLTATLLAVSPRKFLCTSPPVT
jgi:hypothetical protein